MPQGAYPVAAGYGREMTERKQVKVYSGQVVWVGELYFRQPQMGKKTSVGRGKIYEVGSGVASGQWHNFDVADGFLPNMSAVCWKIDLAPFGLV